MRTLAVVRGLYIVTIAALPFVRLDRILIVAEGVDGGSVSVTGHQGL